MLPKTEKNHENINKISVFLKSLHWSLLGHPCCIETKCFTPQSYQLQRNLTCYYAYIEKVKYNYYSSNGDSSKELCLSIWHYHKQLLKSDVKIKLNKNIKNTIGFICYHHISQNNILIKHHPLYTRPSKALWEPGGLGSALRSSLGVHTPQTHNKG